MTTTAVIVATQAGFIDQTLRALGDQRLAPHRVVVIDATTGGLGEQVGDQRLPEQMGERFELLPSAPRATFGQTIRAAQEQGLAIESEWMWLLHDDSLPQPDALAELQRYVATAPKVGIAGCKQVDFDNPAHLLSVGVRYTRAGRRVSDIEPGEIDQGQHDHREDVYAVGTAGMLIRTSTWNHLEGPDPALGPFMDGADLSRRARLAGQRVVVVPTAVVRHARASLWYGLDRQQVKRDGAHSFFPRRVATLHFRLVTARLWAWLLVAAGMLASASVRALWRVATTQTTLAWQELLAPLKALSRLGAIHHARRLAAKTSTVPRGVLTPLYATRGEVLRVWWHRMRTRRVERRARQTPSELEIRERRVIARRRRAGFVLTMAVLTGIGALIGADVFAGSFFSFPTLYGGALSGIDDTYPEIWARFLSAWDPVGDGAPNSQHPFIGMLGVLATLIGAPFGVKVASVANLVFLLGLPLAGITAWFGAGVITRSVLLRMWVALAWAFVPVLSIGIAHGRLSAVVGHILLPLFAVGLARAFGLDQRDVILSGLADAGEGGSPSTVPVVSRASNRPRTTAAAAAGLLLAFIGASTPILLPALVLIAVGLGLKTRPGWLRMVVVLTPGVVLFLPTLTTAARHGWAYALMSVENPPIHLTDFGSGQGEWFNQTPWYMLAGWPAPTVATVIGLSVVGVVVLLAIVGLFRSGSSGWSARFGWVVAALGVSSAIGAQHVLRPAQYDWLGSFQQIPEWSGPGVSLAVAGLLIATAAGLRGTYQSITSRALGVAHLAGGLVAIAMVGLIAAGGTGAVTSLLQTPQWQARDFEPLPALGRQMTDSPDRARALMIAPTDATMVGHVWRSNGPQIFDARHHVPPDDPARADLNELLGQLSAGTVKDLGQRLATHGVGLVLLPSVESPVAAIDHGAREALFAALDSSADLERVTENAAGALWRVKTPAAQAVLIDQDERYLLTSTLTGVDTVLPPVTQGESSTVVLAERAAPGWKATLNGTPLRSLDIGWNQAFEIPADATGHLTITYAPLAHQIWVIGLIATFGLTSVLALPLRRREVLT
ncbi:MAG TPA: glycosyltransferase [Beutenbergiaceae bacterium]|nr:glycosyltransferase [Beutenbergiaceae bacterium]